MKLTAANARIESEKYITTIQEYPGGQQGRGIVICGGGIRLFTSAWVCINMLRRAGCTLPIEIWHLGSREMDDRMRAIVAPLDVDCVDAWETRKKFPARILNGWELKAYSLLHCKFEEVILFDADNVPVVDPEFLFGTKAYKDTGAIFWPDLLRLGRERLIWKYCGVPYRDEAEFESGQIVVNKKTCWKALNLAMWYNEHSDFFYQHILGDKETFHMAFRKLGQRYTMVPKPVRLDNGVMYQHDLEGNTIFQHRNKLKWRYYEENPEAPGFKYHAECVAYIEQLKKLWDGFVERDYRGASNRLKPVIDSITNNLHRYVRVGYDERPISFLPNGRIDKGKADLEQFWDVYEDKDNMYLEIHNEKVKVCSLSLGRDNIWRGRWNHYERMPIELSVI